MLSVFKVGVILFTESLDFLGTYEPFVTANLGRAFGAEV